MKDLILQALIDLLKNIENLIPDTKTEDGSLEITGVKLSELSDYVKKHNVPSNAYFGCQYQDEGAWLYWEVEIPTKETEKLEFKKTEFNKNSFRFVNFLLKENGYKRISCDKKYFEQFEDTTPYDMFVNKEFDRLVKYYSSRFEKT